MPKVALSIASSQRGYRLFAPVYDAVFGPSLHAARRSAIAALGCRPGERLLEVGIGSGLSLDLYPRGVDLVAIDLSTEMLALARERARTRASVSLVRMNAERLAFADGTFDRAVMLFSIAGLPDPVRAISEVRRVLRPGGTLVIASRFRTDKLRDRVFSALLAPVYRLLAYRDDLDRDALVASCGLELVSARPTNLLGYSTVLVCRNPPVASEGGARPPGPAV